MKTYNHTGWTLEAIEQFPRLGEAIMQWRTRDVVLYAHPSDPASLVSVGTTWDQTMRVIVVECRSQWRAALCAATRGQTYTYV